MGYQAVLTTIDVADVWSVVRAGLVGLWVPAVVVAASVLITWLWVRCTRARDAASTAKALELAARYRPALERLRAEHARYLEEQGLTTTLASARQMGGQVRFVVAGKGPHGHEVWVLRGEIEPYVENGQDLYRGGLVVTDATHDDAKRLAAELGCELRETFATVYWDFDALEGLLPEDAGDAPAEGGSTQQMRESDVET